MEHLFPLDGAHARIMWEGGGNNGNLGEPNELQTKEGKNTTLWLRRVATGVVVPAVGEMQQ